MIPDPTPNPIATRLAAMSDVELARSITVERDQNSADFWQRAEAELEGRGHTLASFIDGVALRLDNAPAEAVSREQALARLDGDVPLWSSLVCTSCLGETLVLQRERHQWIVHHYADDQYGHSYVFPGRGPARDVLARFLALEEWQPLAGEAYHLDNWKPVAISETLDLVEVVTEDLDRAEIPHAVQTPLFTPGEGGEWAVRVPIEWLDEAHEVLDEAEDDLVVLYDQAMELYEIGDARRELELYERLKEEDPDNPAVHYNRASLLLEQRRPEEAAEALVEAVSLGLEHVKPSLDLDKGGGLGGIMGILSRLLHRATATPREGTRPPRYPDFIDDAEMLLERLADLLKTNTRIFHCLAAIARMKNDVERAEQYWRRVLDLDPEDQVAYFNLGYLHSELGDEQAPT